MFRKFFAMPKLLQVAVWLILCVGVVVLASRVAFRTHFPLHVYAWMDNNNHLEDKDILKEVAIISTSCDKRHELWGPQFNQLFKYWPALKDNLNFIPIYLVTNFKNFHDPRVETIAVGEDIAWSDNLIKALERIQKKYIILLMDDYMLYKPVDEARLVTILNLMRNNRAAYTELVTEQASLYDGIWHKKVPGLMYRAQRGLYRTSLQASVWDRDCLKRVLKPKESAWDFEVIGNKRSFFIFRPFYLVKEPVFYYLNAVDAQGLGKPEASQYNKDVLEFLQKEKTPLDAQQMPVGR